MEGHHGRSEKMSLISQEKLADLEGKVHSLTDTGAYSAKDAIPQVLNGNGLASKKTENDRKKRAAYQRALLRKFKDAA